MRPCSHNPLAPLALAVVGTLLLGCAGPRQPPAEAQGLARAEARAASGYQPAESGSISLIQQQWIVQGEMLPVSLAWPSSGQRALPLIVYLPGLGEVAQQAGARWRSAWARAGYAVLSVQPLEVDARAWSSELARAADFKALARQHQQPAQVQARLQRLTAALAEAQRRAAAGDALWSRVDFGRMALAGYDLGAQAAALALAEQFRATVLLSPPPLSETAAAQLTGPLLAISSLGDTDPAGLIESPSARLPAFEQMPAGAKYLLLLDHASHASLAGTVAATVLAEAPAGRGGGGNNDGGGGRKKGGGGGMGGGPPGGGGGRGQVMRGDRGGAEQGGGGPEGAVAIELASIAFFDAHLRDKPQARQWLQQQAGDWLQGLAAWRQR